MRGVWLCIVLFLLHGCSGQAVYKPGVELPVREGDVGPISDANPLQQPFTCATSRAGMGAPLIDNQVRIGQPVMGKWLLFDYIKGYSQFCGAPMQVGFYYRNLNNKFIPLSQIAIDSGELPDDIAFTQSQNGRVPFVVRFERGVINRFIYGISALSPWPIKQNTTLDRALWNKRLVLYFLGGISVGHQQSGGISLTLLGSDAANNDHFMSMFNPDLLSRGYVLAGSTGMGTDTSYNLPLLGQTAEMVKQQVVAQYGDPDYTLGVGGSGGAIQQIYNAKKAPGLLDGVIASHLFPDLLTQIKNVGDCELLQYYFDRGHTTGDGSEEFWKYWANRKLVEGHNAIDGYKSRLSIDGSGRPIMAEAEPGSSVCVDGWRGVTPIVFNPKMFLPFIDQHQIWLSNDPEQLVRTHWTHWDDARDIYGLDRSGYANRTYDNVGVQYGLEALKRGDISAKRFLDINTRVGGWKSADEMQLEYAPYYPFGAFALDDISLWQFAAGNSKLTSFGSFVRGTQNLITLLPDKQISPKVKKWLGRDDKQSVWSHHNATASVGSTIAPRTQGSTTAINAAESIGLTFDGRWSKPAISLLIYLDPKLDIHDARQSFVFRERMRKVGSDLDQFSIWGVKPSGRDDQDKKQLGVMAVKAVEQLDLWLTLGHKPLSAEDACWDEAYQLIAQGDHQVWQGVGFNTDSTGVCAAHFPIHSSPRAEAGEPIYTTKLKCALKPVETALRDGTYGTILFSDTERKILQQVFQQGVCDYET